jgi:hypothetical protein
LNSDTPDVPCESSATSRVGVTLRRLDGRLKPGDLQIPYL